MVTLARFAALALCLVAGTAWSERVHKYTVTIDARLSALNVRACFAGTPPVSLSAESLDAILALTDVRVEGSRKPIEPNGSISLKSVPENGCIVYQVNVSRPIRQHDRSGDKIHRIGRDLVASIGFWLWRPEQLAADEDIEIAFALPDGIGVSAPWTPVAPPRDAPAFRIGDARLRLALLDATPPADIDQIQSWIEDAAQTVAALYGRFPQAQTQILVAPGARGDEPTPWAYVVRGGNPAVHFFINQRRPIDEFFADWTAVHELSHLLLPYINPDDIWLSEGVATYYQNILRARNGKTSAEEAWQRLRAGFARGMEGAHGLTLAQATESMYRDGSYMRVYWEGAAMLLIADVRLRQMTAGKQSLDTALAALNECCRSNDRAWSAREVFARLDEVTGTGIFGEIYDRHVASTDFPDLGPTWRALGLATTADGVASPASGREVQLREAIMGNVEKCNAC